VKDCIFCKIVRREIPKVLKFEDDLMIAFDDIRPQADVHVLFVPKKHINSFDVLFEKDYKILSSMHKGVAKIVKEEKLTNKGYKVQLFAGGAQTIDHLHFHLIGPVGLRV
jgi:histidine triad (HIT) family protein